MNKETPYIICPVCGTEMHPAEVFIPNDFFGNPKEIVRDTTGKIEFYTGNDMGLVEEYICDGCNNTLNIEAKLSFDVSVKTKNFFEEEYTSTFNKPKKLKLVEEGLFDD